jgi:hypothetical protein
MATRKVTFSLPEELVATFARRVPPRQRSHFVATALAAKLKERDRLLSGAADIANRSRDVRVIEKDLDRLRDDILEPWDDSASR